MKKLLIVVDYQNDFVHGALGFPGAAALEEGILAAVQATLAGGGYVLFTRDTHPEDYMATREGAHLPVAHCIAGTPGHALYGKLHTYEQAPPPRTALLNKPTFGSPDIGAEAEALCIGAPDEIALCGLVTDICVLANAILLHSWFPHAKLRVPHDLTASANEQNASAALRLLRGMGMDTSAFDEAVVELPETDAPV